MTEPIAPTPEVASPVIDPTPAPVVVQPAADVLPAEQPDESDAPTDTQPEPAHALPTNPETARLIEKNRAANREAAALRQRTKDLEKRLAVYDAQEAAKKRKELGESEALRQELAEAKAKLDGLAAETERMRREAAAVRDFHVLPEYAGYVAAEMAKAGEVADIDEWMSGYRAKHQAFFVPEIIPAAQPKPGNGATPPKEPAPKPAPMKTADGGPSPVASPNKDVEIAQLKEEYKVLSTTKMYEDGAGSRRGAIKRRLAELGAR